MYEQAFCRTRGHHLLAYSYARYHMLGDRILGRGALKLTLALALVAVSMVGPAMAAPSDATAESSQTTDADEECVYYYVHTEKRELVCVEYPNPGPEIHPDKCDPVWDGHGPWLQDCYDL